MKKALFKRILYRAGSLIFVLFLAVPTAVRAQIPIQITNVRIIVHDTSAEIMWDTNVATSAKVDFGETLDYGWFVEAGYSPRNEHRVNITNIKPETTYHYRISSRNTEAQAIGFDRTFKTLEKGKGDMPVISNVKVVYVTGTSATIQWESNEKTTSNIEYGLTNAYGASRGDGSSRLIHDMTVSGLTPDRTYHFRVSSKDADGNVIVSPDGTFRTTLSTQGETIPLEITDVQPTTSNSLQITPSKVAITWKTNKLSTGSVTLGTTGNGRGSSYSQPEPRTFDHRIDVSVIPGTQYFFKVSSRDVFGRTKESDIYSFATPEASASSNTSVSGGLQFYARFDSDVDADYALGKKDAVSTGSVRVSPTSGKNGGAVLINSGSQLAFEGENNFDIQQGTIAFWYKHVWDYSDNAFHTLFTLNNGYGGQTDKYFHIMKRGDTVQGVNNPFYFGLENTKDNDFHHVVAPAEFTSNAWMHVVVRWKYGSESAIYINGVQKASQALNGAAPALGKNFYIGDASTSSTGGNTNAYIDDFAIYNRSLSDSEIQRLYTGGPIELDRDEGVIVLGVSTEDTESLTHPTALYRTANDPKVYAILNGQKYHIPDADSFVRSGYQWKDVRVVAQSTLDAYQDVHLVKSPDSDRIYFLYQRPGKRLKWYLSTPAIFSSYPRNRWSDVVTISRSDIDSFANAELVMTKGSPTIYQIEGSVKHEVSSEAVFMSRGYAHANVVEVSTENLNAFTTGVPLR